MTYTPLTNPTLLKDLIKKLGFRGKIFADRSVKGMVGFVSDQCWMCDKPWTVKVKIAYAYPEVQQTMIDIPTIKFNYVNEEMYLCDEHLEYAQTNWNKPLKIIGWRDNLVHSGT